MVEQEFIDPYEEDDDRVDFDQLMTEAQSLGLQYTGNSAAELELLVNMARTAAGDQHPVPCFGASYDPTDRRCRICDLRNRCADMDRRPRVELVEAKLQPIPCEACGKGVLSVECEDAEGRIRDYACTTVGCQNSVRVQCGWDSEEVVRDIVIGEEVVSEEEPAEESSEGAEEQASKKAPAKKAPAKKAPANKAPKKAPANKAPKKKAPKKKAPKKKAPKKKAPKKKASAKKAPGAVRAKPKLRVVRKAPVAEFAVMYNGAEYKNLTAAVKAITGNTAWGAARFFGLSDLKGLQSGDVLTREWKGTIVKVEVV